MPFRMLLQMLHQVNFTLFSNKINHLNCISLLKFVIYDIASLDATNLGSAAVVTQQPIPSMTNSIPPINPVATNTDHFSGVDPITGVRLAPLPSETTTMVPLASNSLPTVALLNNNISTQSSVPLAPFPDGNGNAQPQQGSATRFVVFNVTIYTIVSLILTKLI